MIAFSVICIAAIALALRSEFRGNRPRELRTESNNARSR
jgi:hypothetical protein